MLFRNKTAKESNRVKTPDELVPEKKPKKITFWFLVWNLFPIIIYSLYTLFIVYNSTQKTFLSKVIVYLLGVYIFAFILLVLVNIGNRSRMKRDLKNYKSATKFLKYAVTIINFSLSIITVVNAFITNGTADFKTLLYAIIVLIITFISVLFEIGMIIVRKNISLIKQNFLELRDKAKNELKNKEEDKQ